MRLSYLAAIAAMSAALKMGNPSQKFAALRSIPAYRSRGKGVSQKVLVKSCTKCPRIGKDYPEAKARRIALAKAYNANLLPERLRHES